MAFDCIAPKPNNHGNIHHTLQELPNMESNFLEVVKPPYLVLLVEDLVKTLSGKITYNGQNFSGGVKRRTCFVAQDDILYPHLTVFETLLFTALLRLPQTLAHEHIVGQVERMVDELGLTHVKNSMIGGPLVRGISGGEKKRVSIGQELLINPSLMLLDEPTSGLDSDHGPEDYDQPETVSRFREDRDHNHSPTIEPSLPYVP